MTHFEQIRRRLTKHHKIRGTRATASCENNTIKIENSAGVGFEGMKIFGASHQPSVNFGEVYKDYFKNTLNYTCLVTGAFAIPLPSAFIGKELTFSVQNIGTALANTLSLSDSDNPLFATTESLLSSSGEINTVTSSKYTYLIIGNVMSSDEISAFWENYLLVATANEVSADLPHPIYSSADGGITLNLNSRNIFDLAKASSSTYWKGTQYKKFTPIVFKKGVRYTVTIGKNLCNSIDYPFDTETVAIVINANGGWNGISIGNTSSGIRYGTKFSVYNQNSDLYLWTYVKGISYEQFFTEVIKEMQIVQGTEELNFEPYFNPVTVAIPSEVTLTDGTIVPLRLGKYKKADYIEMNRSKRSVRYYEYTKAPNSALPLSEQIENDEPSVYDLSSSDLAQELLSLNMPCYLSGSIEVTPNDEKMPHVSGIEVEYYSTTRDEMSILTIDFIDTEGAEIQASKEYSVRKGARYLIIPPHIDGYMPILEKQEGIASGDTTVSLIYKEEENV